MALTRDFRETVQARVKRDAAFRRGFLATPSKAFCLARCQSAKSYCVITSMLQSAFPSWPRIRKFTLRLFTKCLARTGIRLPGICLKSLPICGTRKVCASRFDPHALPYELTDGHPRGRQNALLAQPLLTKFSPHFGGSNWGPKLGLFALVSGVSLK